MPDEELKQKLTAILSADVKDYSRLLSQDRVSTIKTLNAHREMFADFVQQYGGRVVNTPGDNILMALESVSDAVNCAVEIQRELAERNAEVPSSRMLQWRIGVNLGDVTEKDDRIYGEGVNIAARIEGICEPGGICISGTVYDQVQDKLGLEYESLGEHDVKNIAKPIRAYRVLSYPGAAAHRVVKAKGALSRKWRRIAIVIVSGALLGVGLVFFWNRYSQSPLIPADIVAYKKPTVAVLPFTNLSGHPDDEAICDGITDQIITGLSTVPHLSIAASNSVFTYKGKPIKVPQVANELGVRYVLEGSFQRLDDTLRINTQLIDAFSGLHLWAETYDKPSVNLRLIQDWITSEMITRLQFVLTEGQYANEIAGSTASLDALKYFWQAEHHLLRLTAEDLAIAQRRAKRSVEIDPEFAGGWSILGFTHFHQGQLNYSPSQQDSYAQAETYAGKALSIDPEFPKAWALLGSLDEFQGNYDRAERRYEKAVSVSGNVHHWNLVLGRISFRMGRFNEAIALYKKAIRLNAYSPAYFHFYLSYAQYFSRQYEEAIDAASRLLIRSLKGELPPFYAHFVLAAAYTELGQNSKARQHISEILVLRPSFTWQSWIDMEPMKRRSDKIRLYNAVATAGLPAGGVERGEVPSKKKPSIAVLPFENMSGDPEQEYFSDGLTEEIINALAQVEGLMVAARTSSFWFKGKALDISEIGAKLNVATVLEGSVRKHGDRLRITAQLINVEDGYHLWSERYDKKMDDVFSIQEDIAIQIAHKMNVDSKEYADTSSKNTQTENLKAYDLYLKGRFFLNQVQPSKAIPYLQEALKQDPEYALAYAGIAEAYTDQGALGSLAPEEYVDRARQAAMQALELDEELPEAHLALGWLTWQYDWKWQDAENHYIRAIEINPNSADAHSKYGFFLFICTGRAVQGFMELKRGIELDPLDHLLNSYLGVAYLYSGQIPKAIDQLQTALELDPSSYHAKHHLAQAYRLNGQYDKAINLHKTIIDQEGRRTWTLAELAGYYAAIGNQTLAQSIYDELVARSRSEYISPLMIAVVCAHIDRKDEAFEWLEKAYDRRDALMGNIKVLTQLDPIRNDARFIEIQNRLGL